MEKINFQAKWIRASRPTGGVCPVFQKIFRTEKKVLEARLYLTALGVYEARLNGERVSSDVLAPGFARVKIEPMPDERLGWLFAAIDTRHGRIVSRWFCEGKRVRYEITTPVDAEIVIGGESRQVKPGIYTFWD